MRDWITPSFEALTNIPVETIYVGNQMVDGNLVIDKVTNENHTEESVQIFISFKCIVFEETELKMPN